MVDKKLYFDETRECNSLRGVSIVWDGKVYGGGGGEEEELEMKVYKNPCMEIIIKCVDLVSDNLKDMYNKDYPGGWDRQEKITEMNQRGMMFITLWQKNNNNLLAGFASGLKCTEQDETVLYIYEIQITKLLQAHGLGTFFIYNCLEPLCLNLKLNKLMLSVFAKSNPIARDWYLNSMGFKLASHSQLPSGKLRSGLYRYYPNMYILEKTIL